MKDETKEIERLARRICWLEFTPPRTRKRLGTTEAEYWKGLPDRTKNYFREEARRFRWILRSLVAANAEALIERAIQR